MNIRSIVGLIAVIGLALSTATPSLLAVSIESGQVVSDSIDNPGDTNTITFTAVTGDTVVISQTETGGSSFNIKCELFSPSGTSLGYGWGPFSQTYHLSENGIYTILCMDLAESYTGSYNVSMLRMVGYPLSSLDEDIGPVAVGDNPSGTITPSSDLDAATFTGQSGDTIQISQTETGGSSFNIKCELFSPSGTSLGYGWGPFSQTYHLSENGIYTILCMDLAESYTGSYRISTQIVAGPSIVYVPDDPTGLQASDGTYEDYILVNWNAAAQATGYDIWRKEGTSDYAQIKKDHSGTSYQDDSARANTVYTYKVRSRNWYAVSGFSSPETGWIRGNLRGFDYDGDGSSDMAIFRPTSGMWSIRNVTRVYFGSASDHLVPGDYDGNRTTDIAIFRESSGLWSVKNLSRYYLGKAGDTPVQGDYNGDGTAEAGIFREAGGLWSIRDVTRVYFGSIDDTVIPGYYDTDDAKDIAIFRGSTGMWSVRNLTRFYFGSSSDDLVSGDYNGAGKWEGGIFRPSTGLWSIRNVTRFYLGNSTDWPLPGDYDGNVVDDAGIFRDSSGMWAIRNLSRVYFGSTDDIPVTR